MAIDLTITMNGENVHSFNKKKGLARMQFAYVQRMDENMDQGIQVGDEVIGSPDDMDRAQFVIGQLLEALRVNDRRSVDMMCRYLAHRMPQLDGIHIKDEGDEFEVTLEMEEAGDEEE